MMNNNIITIQPEDTPQVVARKLFNTTVPFTGEYEDFVKRQRLTGEDFSEMRKNRFTIAQLKEIAATLILLCGEEEAGFKC